MPPDEVQIAIGTHALLAKSIRFNHLGLLIVDEEQHFGVGQKERLKEIRGDIQVNPVRNANPTHAANGAVRCSRNVAYCNAAY